MHYQGQNAYAHRRSKVAVLLVDRVMLGTPYLYLIFC